MSWVPQSPWRLGKVNQVTIGASANGSGVLGTETRAVLLRATSNCHIRIGVNATAVSTDTPLYSTDPLLVLGIVPGEQVSVIQDTAGGTLWVTELTH